MTSPTQDHLRFSECSFATRRCPLTSRILRLFRVDVQATDEHLVLGKDVRLEGGKLDRYGRIVAKVWVSPPYCQGCPQTLDAGLAVLTSGLMWHYKKYQNGAEPRGPRALRLCRGGGTLKAIRPLGWMPICTALGMAEIQTLS